MFLEILIVILTIVLGTSIGLAVYARWNYGTLESLGIPVTNLTFLMGSTPDLHKRVQHFQDIQRFQKFGSVFGVYEGRKPIVYICDPEVIRLVLVKDFDSFHNRREIDLGHPLVNEMLDFLPVEKWREVRGAMSPILTSGKIKKMSFAMRDSINEFCQALNNEFHRLPGGSDGILDIDIRQRFDGLFIDLICRSAFGIQIGDVMDPANSFVTMFKDLMGANSEFDWMYSLSMVFPFLTKLAPTLESDSASKIAATVRSVMEARRKLPPSALRQNDFVDVLNQMMDKLPTDEYKRLLISETTILAQAINFVLAGFDAMCTTMTMLLYNLAQNPDIRHRLLEEIDEFIHESQDYIPFDKLPELTYLQACLNETLRLCPPFIRPERICTKDWEYKDLKISKGLLVMIPAWAVHRNPKYFPNPETFDPERFMPQNKGDLHPYAFMSFGQGPRNCVGVKYAMEAMKFSLCHLLKEFQFELSPKTKIEYKPGVLFLVMYDPVILNVSRRKE